MFRTLYAKLAIGLIVLLFGIGLFYALVSTSLLDRHRQMVNQQLHRDLARNLVMDRNLVREGEINEPALEQTFRDYMVINPSIEIYLLDLQGSILSFSAEPGKVKRKRVSLEPIDAFLMQQQFPLLGDDPRSHDRQKAFSVTPIPSAEHAEGYLYVVLQGEEYDAVNDAIRDGEIIRLSLIALLVSLIFGVLAGLGIFYRLTRRLGALTHRIDKFRGSDYSQYVPMLGPHQRPTDEIDQLSQSFDQMAERIVSQFTALQHKDHQRRELVAQVSHDLRTPLTSLQGYLETLVLKQATLSAEAQREYLQIALRHGQRLGKLVDSLFELAKLDAKESLPHKELFVIAELIQDVVQKYQLRADEQGLELSTEFADDGAFVIGDIGMIERVLENLIENALAHTGPGDTLRLQTEIQAEQILVAVVDSGQGIGGEDLPYIFDRFYQGSNAITGNEHAGLGLAIVKRILALHGSQIKANSTKNGTQFLFPLSMPEK